MRPQQELSSARNVHEQLKGHGPNRPHPQSKVVLQGALRLLIEALDDRRDGLVPQIILHFTHTSGGRATEESGSGHIGHQVVDQRCHHAAEVPRTLGDKTPDAGR